MKRARILLADDHGLVLEGGQALLKQHYEIVGTVSDGRSLVDAALRLKPDLILMDISMPLLNGIAAALQIKQALPGTKVLFLTMHSEHPYVQAAFEAGANGYMLKSDLREDLVGAVRLVLDGGLFVSSGVAGDWDHLPGPALVSRALTLSAREREVLQLIAEGRSGKEIVSILGISPSTISFHKDNIKRKLGVRTTAELTRNAIAEGLV